MADDFESWMELISEDLSSMEEEDLVEDRFADVSAEEIEYLTSRRFSKNTSKKIVYVRKLFCEWRTEKNKKLLLSMSKVPSESVEQWSVDDLNRWLPFFITEVRKQNKSKYVPSEVHDGIHLAGTSTLSSTWQKLSISERTHISTHTKLSRKRYEKFAEGRSRLQSSEGGLNNGPIGR